MNFGIRREEAIFIRDLIISDINDYGVKRLKKMYGNIDLEGMLQQLDIIIELGDSVDEKIIF